MPERNNPAGPDQAGQASNRATSDVPVHGHVVLRHVLRVVLAVALVLWFIVAGLLLGLRYVVLPRVDSFRPRIESIVSEKIRADFRIGKLAPHWLGFQPGVDITDLTIRDRHGNLALNVPHATATVAWRSLVELSPLLSSVIVDRPDVLIERDADGQLAVAGVAVPSAHTGNATFTTWLLRQQAIVLRGGTLRWRDSTRDVPELTLHDIRLAILNDGYDHRFALQAPSEGTVLHGALDFRAHFRHARFSQAGKPIDWTGDTYVSTGPVDLPMLARYVDLPIATYAGRIDNAIWAHFSEGRIQSASGVLDGVDVALRVRATQPKLNLPVAHFRWQVGANPGDYTLKLTDFHAELGQPPLEDGTPVVRALALSTLDAHFRQQSVQHGQLFYVSGDRIDLGILAEFMRALPLPSRVLNALVRFNPRGLVANYELGMERERPEANQAAAEQRVTSLEPIIHYRFKGDLQGISVAAQEPPPGLTPRNHPRAGLPGFENLWGHIDSDETQGTIKLDTAKSAVTLPGEFDNPRLTFDRLYGAADWTVAPKREPGETHKAFRVNVSEFGLANDDASVKMTARYSNPGHGRGSLDLRAEFDRAKLASVPRYLPTGLSERLRNYLGHGLQAGTSKGATIEVHGDLTKFPYTRDPDAGLFRIVAPFTGGRFDPSPYPPRKLRNGLPNIWPALDGIDGVFRLNENKLAFDVARGHYRDFALRDVSGRIDDLGTLDSHLIITGTGRGPLADLIDYADNSALGGLSGHIGQKVRAQGPATLALKLSIPRVPHSIVQTEGTIGFLNNRLTAARVPPLSNLTGSVHFTNRSAMAERLAGQFLGGDVRANGGLREDGSYAFDVSGQIATAAARSLDLGGPVRAALDRMSGQAPYALSVRGRRGRLPDVTASSDLSALALDLPAPFGKAAGTPMPLRFGFHPGSGTAGLQQAELTLGPLSADYELRGATVRQLPEVVRGAIGVNREVELPSDEVVSAAVDLPAFDADAWRRVVQEWRAAIAADGSPAPGAAAPAASPAAVQPVAVMPAPPSADLPAVPAGAFAPYLPSRFAVHVGTLTFLKRHWEDVVVGATRSGRQWQANVASSQVSGHLSWQPGPMPGEPGTLEARLARLVVPAATENDLLGRAMSTPVQNMPAIDLVVNELIVRGHDFGRLQVNARNIEEHGVPVWKLDTLDLSNPDARLTATANWRAVEDPDAPQGEPSPRRTALDFHLDIKDAGALLERAGIPHTLKGGEGVVSGDVNWRGGPTAIDYPTLNGDFAVDLRHGQFLRIDPGVARLLGVLSLQSVARFATMDFRDVIGEGLPFSRVSGSSRIHNGVGTTNDTRIVTAPAHAEVSGSVDLANRTQALSVHVAPTISAGAGVIAAAVVNPLIGLGALVADIALSHSIESAFAFQYSITGTWAKPVVERVNGDQGKMDAQTPAAAH